MLHDDIRMSSKFAFISMRLSFGRDPKRQHVPRCGDRAEGSEGSLYILHEGCGCTGSVEMAVIVRLFGVRIEAEMLKLHPITVRISFSPRKCNGGFDFWIQCSRSRVSLGERESATTSL
jgi:hypothetical protein